VEKVCGGVGVTGFDTLSEHLDNLVGGRYSSYSYAYDVISTTITELDGDIAHLPDVITDVFFDYTDLLEGFLLVLKRRGGKFSDVKDILIKFRDYYSKVRDLVEMGNSDDVIRVADGLAELKSEVSGRNLLPTLDEYDQEIKELFDSMSDEEKEEVRTFFKEMRDNG